MPVSAHSLYFFSEAFVGLCILLLVLAVVTILQCGMHECQGNATLRESDVLWVHWIAECE